MARGGKREGAGRRKGTVSAQTQAKRELAEKAASEGVTPLEVMLITMRTLWDQAVDPDSGKVVSMGKAMQANAVAKDAAPFIHPKLSSVEAKTEVTVNDVSSEPEVSEAEWSTRHAG